MSTESGTGPRRSPGRVLVAAGLGFAALGMAGYAAQLSQHRLTTPWYLPASATLGAVLVAASLWQRRSVWRVLALLLVVLVAGAEWTFLLSLRLPAYSGPVAAGRSFPAFSTMRADGTPFTRADLEGGPNHVLVFFRGRW